MKNDQNSLDLFHPIVKDWFIEEHKLPSAPQKMGWPVIASGKHTLILAPTGSGKTLAAFLWCIDELFRTANNLPFGVHTLYISPLKALNNDINVNLQRPLKGITELADKAGLEPVNIRTHVRTGDTPSNVRQAMVKKPPHILITTPESFYLLLTSPRGREIFYNVRYLIVDEIHALSNNKRGVHLSLSMERLMALCKRPPVRIGLSATQRPLERIAYFLGGRSHYKKKDRFTRREVCIVDCGQRKKTDLKVISPVKDFGNLPESSVWPAVIDKLYSLILNHKTTLIFANMRAQSEKIVRLLNDLHKKRSGEETAEIAQPHHGSMSREMRYDVEGRLKEGRLPAVVATASLELGIDIGSIDLVVQLESPRSIAGSLQRVGRSGHLLSATSKGRIIPLYPSDLDNAAALTRCMKLAEIEETVIPENCLDVLAQQISAEVSMSEWQRDELFNLFRQSYCYRHLEEAAFNHVTDMLSGRFSESNLPSLQPRLNWDRINDRLISRRGTKIMATTNGGTIPDRGYYTVYLSEGNTRIGEMEEEFVFESRPGDIFFLGNHEWRINEIKQDRILVSANRAIKPRAPFWKGEIPFRDYSTSLQVAAFREKLQARLSDDNLHSWLEKEYFLDHDCAANLVSYFRRQIELTRQVSGRSKLVVETFTDTAGEQNLIIHSPFGGRVNAAWAIVLAAFIERLYNTEVQYAYNDDGILIRLRENEAVAPVSEMLHLLPQEAEKILLESLAGSPLFSIQFRYNAARALILPRSRPGKRIPLWLQRLRAADLLQAVRKYPDFPILIETYRSCLEDHLDLGSLLRVVQDLHAGKLTYELVETPYPSPMASGLLFNFLSNQVYELDRTRGPGEIAYYSNELLAQIMSQQTIPQIVTEEMVNIAAMAWQHLTPDNHISDREGLAALISKLGPIDETEIRKRAAEKASDWLNELTDQNRIVHLRKKGWISAEHKDLFLNTPDNTIAIKQVRRYLESTGPVAKETIIRDTGLSAELVASALESLHGEHQIVRGRLLAESDDEKWCDRNNFSHLYRRAISARRRSSVAVDKDLFRRFLLSWHRISEPQQTLKDVIEKYQGMRFPLNFMQVDLLRTRKPAGIPANRNTENDSPAGAMANGEIIAIREQKRGEKQKFMRFFPRGSGRIIYDNTISEHNSPEVDEESELVKRFLRENGASLFDDIMEATGIATSRLEKILSGLADRSVLTCDDLASLSDIGTDSKKTAPVRRLRTSRSDIQGRLQSRRGRWFLTTSFQVQGKVLDDEERLLRQTRLLLNRYGILVKEWYRFESGLLPWYRIFQTLKKLEWQGEIRRGYFIEGLSGVQFAHPAALNLLESDLRPASALLSTIDPALPFGSQVGWDLKDRQGNTVPVTRLMANHLLFTDSHPSAYMENYARRIFLLEGFSEEKSDKLIEQVKQWFLLPALLRPRKKIVVESIENQDAAAHFLSTALLASGFEKDGKKLVLWASAV